MFEGKKRVRWGELSNEQRCWVWAVCDQVHLYNAHDEVWVKKAAAGWRDVDALFDMLSTYMVRRGKFANFISIKIKMKTSSHARAKEHDVIAPHGANLECFAKSVVRASQKLNPGNISGFGIDAALNQELKDFKVQATTSMELSHTPRSAFTKAMWFCLPDDMTMFDSRANAGLKKWFADNGQKAKVTAETFFECFEKFYSDGTRKNAEDAIQWWGVEYPYPRRIADKFLWLYANPRRERIIARFHPERL